MTDKKYTNEDIISSLKIIATTRNCNECKIRNCRWGTCNCEQITANAALDLFNRQQTEIDRLEKESKDKERAYNDEFCLRKEWQTKYRELLKEKQTTKSEAYKEFAEELKRRLSTCVTDTQQMMIELRIDNLLKENVGDSNDTANKGDRL